MNLTNKIPYIATAAIKNPFYQKFEVIYIDFWHNTSYFWLL